jgi:hypothetical protein
MGGGMHERKGSRARLALAEALSTNALLWLPLSPLNIVHGHRSFVLSSQWSGRQSLGCRFGAVGTGAKGRWRRHPQQLLSIGIAE